MTLQVLRDDWHKNRSRLVEFEISLKQVQSLNRIMSLAGIDKRNSWSPWGWDWDSEKATCTVVQPWMYRGRSTMLSGCSAKNGTRHSGPLLR